MKIKFTYILFGLIPITAFAVDFGAGERMSCDIHFLSEKAEKDQSITSNWSRLSIEKPTGGAVKIKVTDRGGKVGKRDELKEVSLNEGSRRVDTYRSKRFMLKVQEVKLGRTEAELFAIKAKGEDLYVRGISCGKSAIPAKNDDGEADFAKEESPGKSAQ